LATQAERRLLDEAGSGELIDVSGLPPDERAVAATVLRDVCVGRSAGSVPAQGIFLRGPIINEPVDLRWCEISFPPWFRDAIFRGGIGLVAAKAPSVALVECVVLGGLDAQRAELSYGLTTREGILTRVQLGGAVIGGDLELHETTITSPPGGPALSATSVEVGGSVRLTRVHAVGVVDLAAARIGSHLECPGVELGGQRGAGVALNLDKAEIGGSLLLERATARGQIRGRGCSIGGSVLWEGSDLVGADGVALWFDGADIDGNLAIVHAQSGPHQIFCRPYVEGAVRVNGANIRGAVIVQHADLEGTTAEALMLSGCSVGMSLIILDARLGGDVWLTDTKARALVDDLDPAAGSWRTARRLVLTGFQYDRFERERDPRLRFGWLRQTDGHQAQAWSQLADVYRRNGRAEDARRAEIARENDRLERAGLGAPERAGRWILRCHRPRLPPVACSGLVACDRAGVRTTRLDEP
jgi:hypothetical protein